MPALPPPNRPAAGADPAGSAAGKALLFSVPAPCCAPLSLAGAYYAARAVSLARQHGVPVPRRAVAAWVLVALSLLTWGAITASYVRAQHRNKQALQAVRQRLAGKREAAVLDQQTACDLVEEHFRAEGYERSDAYRFACHGPLESGPDRALLRGVELETLRGEFRLNACLARTERWFSLMVTPGERCPSPPPARAGSGDTEQTLRKEAAKQADEEEVAAFTSALARVKEAVAAQPRTTRPCPKVDVATVRGPGSPQLRLFTIDLDILDARSEEDLNTRWEFLTSSEVRLAIEPRASMEYRAREIRGIARESGPFLLVYQSESRAWPKIDEDNKPEVGEGGRFSGWVVLVDLSNARLVCEAPLRFENSVAFWERKPDRRRLDPAVKDLKDQFERRAIAALRGIGDGQFRLGYRLVE